MTGTASGFNDLDEITGGFQPGNLIIMAARPAMGKSALITNFAENAALEGAKAVALFSLEMSESELAQRFIASQASIKGDDLRKGKVPASRRWEDHGGAEPARQVAAVTSTTRPTCRCSTCAPRRGGCPAERGRARADLIDYLQLMRADGAHDNRVEQIGQISPRPEDARARAGGPGHRALAALPRRRAADGQAAGALGPSRVGLPHRRDARSACRTAACTADRRARRAARLPRVGAGRRDVAARVGRVSNAFCTGRQPVFRLRTASAAACARRRSTGSAPSTAGDGSASWRRATLSRCPRALREPARPHAGRRRAGAAGTSHRRRLLPPASADAVHDPRSWRLAAIVVAGSPRACSATRVARGSTPGAAGIRST